MKGILLLLLLLQAAPSGDRAEAERLFDLGRRLYAEGDAVGAVAAFEGALATGWTGAALHYDLGTACLATADLGCAVLHLEKAHRLRPADAQIAHNRRIAREQAGLDAGSAPTPRDALRRAFGALGLLLAGYALFLAAVVLLGVRMWTRSRAAGLRRALVVLVPLALVVLGAGTAVWLDARAPEAVVLAETTLRPRPGAADGRLLDPGRIARLGARRGAWVEVRLPDGARGWVRARDIGEL